MTEATLHESVVTLTLSGGTYERSSFKIRDALTVAGIPGVEIASFGIERVSDTQITVELEFNGNMNSDATLTFTVGADAIENYDGPALAAQITVTAVTESVVASTSSPLTEATLHESVVTLTLSGGTYARRWDIEDALTVAGIPGVEIASFGIDRVSDTQITVELEFNGNINSDATLTFTVGAEAIVGYNGPALAAQITVAAITESVVASTSSPLTEVTLHESVVTLTLSGGTYARRWDIEDALTVAGIPGVEIASFGIERVSDTQITVELEFNGNINSDATLTFTVGAEAIVGYNGPALVAQITVTAITENSLAANFPNPFNPETWIAYQLAEPTEVAITIYAINGQVVRRLALEHQRAGAYAAHWDGRNEFGQPVASGVYFYTLIAGDFIATRKMLIQK